MTRAEPEGRRWREAVEGPPGPSRKEAEDVIRRLVDAEPALIREVALAEDRMSWWLLNAVQSDGNGLTAEQALKAVHAAIGPVEVEWTRIVDRVIRPLLEVITEWRSIRGQEPWGATPWADEQAWISILAEKAGQTREEIAAELQSLIDAGYLIRETRGDLVRYVASVPQGECGNQRGRADGC